jgi:hypothetical protein
MSTPKAEDGERCIHYQLDNGIHKFTFIESSSHAVDEYLHQLTTLYDRTSPGETLRILLDSSEVCVQPVNYTTQSASKINARYPRRPATRTACMYRTRFMASLGRTAMFTQTRAGVDKVQFFCGDNCEAEALEWLQVDEVNANSNSH